MRYVYLILNWTFGVFFLLGGVALFSENSAAASLLLLISFLLLPPIRKFAYARTNRGITFRTRAIVIPVLFVLSIVVFGQDGNQPEQKQQKPLLSEFNANKTRILADVKTAIDAKEYQKALSLSAKYSSLEDKELSALRDTAQTKLSAQKEEQRHVVNAEKLKKKIASDSQRVKDIEEDINTVKNKLKRYYATTEDVAKTDNAVIILTAVESAYESATSKEEKLLASKTTSLLSVAKAVRCETFASRLEETFVKTGIDAEVKATGAGKKTLRITYVLMSKPIVYQFQNTVKVDAQAKDMGFTRIIYTNGFDGSLGETWTVDLD